MQVATESPASTVAAAPAHALLFSEAADFIFGVTAGSVVALEGIDGAALRSLVDQADTLADRRALFVRLQPSGSVESYVEQVIAAMADAAAHLWPVWFTDISFAMCRDDALGRQAAGAIARTAAAQCPGVSAAWTEAAAVRVLARRPRLAARTLPAVELAQLSHAISKTGIILIVDVNAIVDTFSSAGLTHALEWIARHSPSAVVALFDHLPSLDSPFDGILFGARCVIADPGSEYPGTEPAMHPPATWLVPWRGAPHPMSEVEQRLSGLLRNDAELADLFRFNWTVDTVRGSHPKVDMVWTDGRLVVELDGFSDHTTRRAFNNDRRRDFELALSGYCVLRLPNDEIQQDFGLAIEKIRDLVRVRRAQLNEEAQHGKRH